MPSYSRYSMQNTSGKRHKTCKLHSILSLINVQVILFRFIQISDMGLQRNDTVNSNRLYCIQHRIRLPPYYYPQHRQDSELGCCPAVPFHLTQLSFRVSSNGSKDRGDGDDAWNFPFASSLILLRLLMRLLVDAGIFNDAAKKPLSVVPPCDTAPTCV